MSKIKSKFPIYNNQQDLIYLDSAATSLKPQIVIDKITDYYSNYSANVHRGLYPMSIKATEEYESAREKVAKFINANPEEIIFTSGATESLNLIPSLLKINGLVKNKPSILISEAEHNSNVLPWIKLGNVEVARLDKDYYPQFEHKLKEKKYDILSYSLISNVTGAYVEVKDRSKAEFVVIDACQAVAHTKIDVKKLDCDFLTFSGHKFFGPTGIGVLYIKKELLDKMKPAKTGGGTINKVARDEVIYKNNVERFEAGTPNIAGAIGLSAAVDFFEKLNIDELSEEEEKLRKILIEELNNIENFNVYHPKNNKSFGVVSFSHSKVHSHDISDHLGQNNICVRAGNHCTHLLHSETLKTSSSVRVSLSIYNEKKDIEVFIEKLKEAIEVFS